MNRSVLCEVLHSTSLTVPPGTLAVAASWRHPTRGLVDCPAHPLIGAHIRRAGFTADCRPLPEEDIRGGATAAPTTVVAVSYQGPEGGHRGIALAAHREDTGAVRLAHRQIAAWQAVLRTRRVLHPTVPTPHRATDGATDGVTDMVTDGARPHRTPVPAQAAAPAPGRPWRVCGCPARVGCPAAENGERALRRFLGRGDEVIVVGVPAGGAGAWPAWPTGSLPEGVRRVGTPEQADGLSVPAPDRVAFVVAPGAVISEAATVLRALRRRFPRLRGQHPREWCYTMDDHHTALGSALAQSDVLLVIGGGSGAGSSGVTGGGHGGGSGRGTSPAVGVAVAQAARAGVPVRAVPTLDRLRPADIDAATITVLDAQDDGPEYQAVSRALDGLGPTAHVWRQVVSTTTAPPHRTGRAARVES